MNLNLKEIGKVFFSLSYILFKHKNIPKEDKREFYLLSKFFLFGHHVYTDSQVVNP